MYILQWVMYVIYNIRNKINGRIYIGCSKNFKNRFREHRKKLNQGIHENMFLQRAWVKYGPESFVFEIVETLATEEDMFSREKHLIKGTPNIYNLAAGGQGGNTIKYYTQDQKRQLSEKLSKIRKAYFKKHGTDKLNPFLNISPDRRKELLRTWSECKKGLKNNFAKYPQRIGQFENGQLIKIWDNVYETSDFGFTRKYIIGCCKGDSRYKSHKGFTWAFMD